jgi:hypothetical protein
MGGFNPANHQDHVELLFLLNRWIGVGFICPCEVRKNSASNNPGACWICLAIERDCRLDSGGYHYH